MGGEENGGLLKEERFPGLISRTCHDEPDKKSNSPRKAEFKKTFKLGWVNEDYARIPPLKFKDYKNEIKNKAK